MDQSIFEKIEGTPCPGCGRKTLLADEDPYGVVAQCTSLDCLELFDADEILEAEADQ